MACVRRYNACPTQATAACNVTPNISHSHGNFAAYLIDHDQNFPNTLSAASSVHVYITFVRKLSCNLSTCQQRGPTNVEPLSCWHLQASNFSCCRKKRKACHSLAFALQVSGKCCQYYVTFAFRFLFLFPFL